MNVDEIRWRYRRSLIATLGGGAVFLAAGIALNISRVSAAESAGADSINPLVATTIVVVVSLLVIGYFIAVARFSVSLSAARVRNPSAFAFLGRKPASTSANVDLPFYFLAIGGPGYFRIESLKGEELASFDLDSSARFELDLKVLYAGIVAPVITAQGVVEQIHFSACAGAFTFLYPAGVGNLQRKAKALQRFGGLES